MNGIGAYGIRHPHGHHQAFATRATHSIPQTILAGWRSAPRFDQASAVIKKPPVGQVSGSPLPLNRAVITGTGCHLDSSMSPLAAVLVANPSGSRDRLKRHSLPFVSMAALLSDHALANTRVLGNSTHTRLQGIFRGSSGRFRRSGRVGLIEPFR